MKKKLIALSGLCFLLTLASCASTSRGNDLSPVTGLTESVSSSESNVSTYAIKTEYDQEKVELALDYEEASAGQVVGLTVSVLEAYKNQYQIETAMANDQFIPLSAYAENSFEGEFTMPSKEVTVKISLTTKQYSISANVDSQYGSLSFDKVNAASGETIIVFPTVDEKYSLTGVRYNGFDATKNGDGTYSFVMPAENVVVTASFQTVSYSVKVVSPSHLQYSLDKNDGLYQYSNQVEIHINEGEGYRLDTYVAKDSTGKEISLNPKGVSTFSFPMPSSDVTITLTEKAVGTSTEALYGLYTGRNFGYFNPNYDRQKQLKVYPDNSIKFYSGSSLTVGSLTKGNENNVYTFSSGTDTFTLTNDGEALSISNSNDNYFFYKSNFTSLYGYGSTGSTNPSSLLRFFSQSGKDEVYALFKDGIIHTNVTVDLVSGKAFEADSILSVKSKGTELAYLKVTKAYNLEYMNDGQILEGDIYHGTYSNGQEQLTLDGFGKGTLKSQEGTGQEGTYTIENDIVNLVINGKTSRYLLDKAKGTYSPYTYDGIVPEGTSYSGRFSKDNTDHQVRIRFLAKKEISFSIEKYNLATYDWTSLLQWTRTYSSDTNKKTASFTIPYQGKGYPLTITFDQIEADKLAGSKATLTGALGEFPTDKMIVSYTIL